QEAYLRGELERRQAEFANYPERQYLQDIVSDLQDDLLEEKSADRAIRRVWASLWSERAYHYREYYGIDHRRVYMGVAVHPTFVGERLESVVFTNLEPDADMPLYRVISQVGEVGVAEPSDPSATPEILSFRRDAAGEPHDITLVAPSSLAPGGARLWDDPEISELARALFAVQEHFAKVVYPQLTPLSLDVEVDIARDGRIVIKQARPYTPRL
ncbi:MAG TPA: PEP/pyruvate-binding domain-containing protein, partial [Polyangiaceae bacterium]|nr:PEP/pyruvate-binding domain-containing protein [Polyangiaceae bacterium]